jgi:glycosyltransferase involved in cell wall biosynthesis
MTAETPELSVVLPVRDERESLAPLLDEIRAALGGRRYEMLAVDDGSTDGSLETLRGLARAMPELRVLRLGAPAGQSAALAAGWEAARADIVVTLDADGQNDPADIPRLLARLTARPDLTAVVGARTRRRDSGWKLVQSRVANTFRNWITGHRVRDTACGLKVMRRAALGGLPRFDGMHRFLPTLIALRGGRFEELPVAHRPRRHGRTKYGAWNRALRGLRDALGVRWLARRRLRFDVTEVRD